MVGGHRPPVFAGEIVVIGGALFVGFRNELFRLARRQAVAFGDAPDPFRQIGADEDMEGAGVVLQNVIGAATDEEGGLFACDLADDLGLDPEEAFIVEVEIGVILLRGNAPRTQQSPEEAEPLLLIHLFEELLLETALLRGDADELLVVKGDPEPLGQSAPDLMAAAAKLPPDSDDIVFLHENSPGWEAPLPRRRPDGLV
ncbi:MAG: hypothetical protein BWY77_01989 [bacterium ADurb.Bin431]|nr:MAG: hypothetical protein BWY77_01989 [bacterium ADurb.Bin431]